MKHNDDHIVIMGAGPAGLASALALRQQLPNLKITVIEKGDLTQFKPGETVPGQISRLFQHLNIWNSFLAQEFWPEYGRKIIWGGVYEEPSLLKTSAGGWHLSRPAFDQWLVDHCADKDIDVVTCWKHPQVRKINNRWAISYESEVVHADFLINATGNPGLIKENNQSFVLDQLVATYFIAPKVSEETYTTIAAAPNGWWYHCNLTDGAVFSFVTDPKHLSKSKRQSAKEFYSELPEDLEFQESFKTVTSNQAPNWFTIRTHHSQSFGDKWLAVGDALMKFDPLSGQGIYKAFETAIWASYAISDYLSGDDSAMTKYKLVSQAMLNAYQVNRSRFYHQETTYQTAFWAKRKTN